MITAVIFDMDGTMVNTENLWGDVHHRMTEKYNIPYDEAVRVKMMGKKDAEGLAVFKEYHHLNVSVEELITVRRQMILKDLSMISMQKGLVELLDLLDQLQIKKAIATSSFTEFCYKVLEKFDLKKRFEVIVTGDDVTISKPDPAIFLEAAKKLTVLPDVCLVLEDAQNGVEAARNANMKVIALPHQHSKHHDFSKATMVLQSMQEIDEQLLRSV